MDDSDDHSGEKKWQSELDSNCPKEIVWSVGDQCRAKWSGDNQLYTGVVKKLKHVNTGKVIALVKFSDYDSDDCEEIDVEQLLKIAKTTDGKNTEKPLAEDGLDEYGTSVSGFFKPFTGSEDISRLQHKYGHESDSDCDERSSSSDWISPTPYQTKGKVSEWKIRSPAKSQAFSSQRRKRPLVKVKSSQKKEAVGQRRENVQTDRKNQRITSDDIAPSKTVAVRSSARGSSLDVELRDTAENDSAFYLTSEEGLFEGFDEDDMEKPKFSFAAPSEKVPFCLDDKINMQIPAPLNQYLRDYQREGIQFLYSHYKQNRGAILGDDMGLGKTVQVIGFLSALMGKEGNRRDVLQQKPRFIRLMSDTPDIDKKKQSGPVLIIGPGSVLYNWLEELETWAHFTVRKYHGADKASCLVDVGRGKVEVVVTTFETCRDNIKALNKIKWDAVIVDEVHRIKGLKAQTTKTLRTLKCVRRYGLTGTALQNNMSELWCILDWAQPNVLGDAEDFEENFVRPIELGQKQNATKRELAEARKKKEEFAAVRNCMMVRRTKKLIADQLPVKTDRVVFCQLAPLQVSVYRAVLSHHDLKVVLLTNDKCPCGSGSKRGRCCFKKLKSGRSAKSIMFTFMHVLLKTSNHIALLIPHARMSSDQLKQAKHLCNIAFKDHPEFLELARDAAFRTLSDPKYCGKMKVLHGMLSVFAKTHSKVLVFSYSTRLLDILEQHIVSEGHEYRRIDGSVTGYRRQKIVREFNSDPNIFLCLVSTKAGGLGLNMTGANKVVIFDPNWNPSHDLQAQDRAYRIGQRRDVEVYRLISAGSIEENIYLRQIYKQQLDNVAIGTENARRYFKGIQGDADNRGELFGIKNMFQLRTDDSCLTMDILSRNAKVEAGIAGYDVADYIPSWREQEDAEDNSVDIDSDDGGREGGESSDEDTFDALKDLFDPVSDDEEQEKQALQKIPNDDDPKPSTSGLHIFRKSLPGTSRTGPLHQAPGTSRTESLFHRSDMEPDVDERATRPSKPTTRLRNVPKKDGDGGSSQWCEETCATKALSFLDEADGSVQRKGKAPLRKGQGSVKKKGVMCGGRKNNTAQVPVPPVDDSLVTPSFSSVSSVFEQYGVVHVHENLQVVGGSRVEDHVTRCAMHDVFELCANSQAPAVLCDPMSQSSEEDTMESSKTQSSGRKGQKGKGTRGRTPSKDHNSARTVDHCRWHLLVGQTPSAIRKKHWGQLKELKKCQDEITLAQRVLVASPEERLAMLKELYRSLHEKALHETLDTILSKPVEHPKEAAGDTTQGDKTPARTRTARSQTGKGKKNTGRARTTSSKKPVARRKRRIPRLLYEDMDDTQLLQAPRTTSCLDDDPASDDSGFDVGARVTPSKIRATPKKQKRGTLRSGQTQQSTVSPSLFDKSEIPVTYRKITWKDPDSGDEKNPEKEATFDTEDIDGLLNELGKKRSDNEQRHGESVLDQDEPDVLMSPPVCGRKQKNVDLNQKAQTGKRSMLDDIFGEPEDCQVKKRKPPPSRGSKKRTERCKRTTPSDSGGEIVGVASTSGVSSVTKSPVLTNTGTRSTTTSSSEIFSEMMNNSTLRDDDVDCFGEPSQWKKRHKVRKTPVKNIDRLLQESNDSYFQLFESGRLVKKRQKEEREKLEKVRSRHMDRKVNAGKEDDERDVGKESSDIDPSGSLFS